MNTGTIIVIAGLVVVAIGAGVYFFMLRRKEKARIESMSPKQREIYELERSLQKTTKEWDKKVSGAEKALQKAISQGQSSLGSYKGIRLYQDRVETAQGAAYFEKESVSATADTAGNIAMTQRVTLTRLVAGGVIGGLIFPKKKTHDSRELYLCVQADSFESVVECDPDHGPKVRQFATNINNTARNARALREARENAIAKAREQLDLVKAEREQSIRTEEQKLGEAQKSGA